MASLVFSDVKKTGIEPLEATNQAKIKHLDVPTCYYMVKMTSNCFIIKFPMPSIKSH